MPRYQPYTDRGIKRVPCFRCGKKPSVHQWQICSDKRVFRPICLACDVAMNELVLRWMRFKDWRAKMREYRKLRRG